MPHSSRESVERPEWARALSRISKARARQAPALDLCGLGLASLPDLLWELTHLQALDLSNNHLETLPEEIEKLTRLRCLDLTLNKLTSLPQSLRRMSTLEELFLHGNSPLHLPDEIMGPTSFDAKLQPIPARRAQDILEYHFHSRGAAGIPLQAIKIVLVGRGGVGKTSLVKRLTGKPFDAAEKETHGINICALTLPCVRGAVEASIWDFGGQLILHAMHEFFLTPRTLYLLVLSPRDDEAERDAVYWLRIIRSQAGQAPVIVVLNKSGGETAREMDRRRLEREFQPLVGWGSTECAEEDPEHGGIVGLGKLLAAAAEGMPDVWLPFPARWTAIKEKLAHMPDAYISYAEYARRCQELGESDAERQQMLASWLHDLGVALHYGNDPRLRELSILRPDWLANGIYAILRANHSGKGIPLAPEGVITLEGLAEIYRLAEEGRMLNAADYPRDKWPFLLELMSQFHLGFPLGEHYEKILVPALLPGEEPLDAAEPAGPEAVHLRYQLDVLPAALIPRFLYRTYSLTVPRMIWLRGAMLSYGEARAKIWSSPDERCIYMTVAVAEPRTEAKRDLLTILRGILFDLLGEYHKLEVVEELRQGEHWVATEYLRQQRLLPTGMLGDDPRATTVVHHE